MSQSRSDDEPAAPFAHRELERWRAEAERLVVENAALRARVAELEAQGAALLEKVATLSRLAFGKSSEKKPKPAGEGEKTDDDGGGGGGGGGGGAVRRRGQRPGSVGHGRRDYSHLPTTEVVHDVPADERACPRCGTGYAPFGEERCEQLHWEVRVSRIVHRYPTYRRACRCPVRGVLVAPPVPKPIAKGRFTAGFLARLVTEKFVLGRPVHRITAALAMEGCEVAEGTLAGVLTAVSALLAPLAAAITERNSAAGHAHVDETSWQVFQAVEGKENNRWWLWVFVGPDSTVFTIARSRSTKVAAEHFGVDLDADTLTEGRQLLISSDFFTVYQSLASIEGIDPLYCWAHIRRYFIRAGDAHPELAGWTAAWLVRIGALYVAHRGYGAAEPGSVEASRAQAQITAALATIDTVRQAEAADLGIPAPARKVLATFDREWDGLVRHGEFPELPLDNNTAERALRNPVVGRKNYYGSGSVASAELAGRAWTITATAARAGLNPLRYLTDYLDACAAAGGKAPDSNALAAFLPWQATDTDLARWRGQAGPDP